MFNIIVNNFIVLYDFICIISCLPVITYAFGRWFYPMRLTCTFKVCISFLLLFWELKPIASSSCSTKWASRNFCSDLFEPSCSVIKKNDALKMVRYCEHWFMHYAFQQCYYKAFPSSFLSTDKKTNLSNMNCKFTIDMYINCDQIFR